MFYYLLSQRIATDHIFEEDYTYKVNLGLYSSLSALKKDLVKDLSARYFDFEDYNERMHDLTFEIDSIEEDDIDLENSVEIDDFEIEMLKVIE